MTNPELLSSLEGQQYLVLRPTKQVAESYAKDQDSLLARLPDSVSFPNVGHVTLRGFSEGARAQRLGAALEAWAASQAPISLSVEGIDVFPPPFQILISRLERSEQLVEVYRSLTRLLDDTDFGRIGELNVEDWIFHLSLVYCNTLSEADWYALAEEVTRAARPRPSELISEAEFVWYESGIEHTRVLPFGG
jgi:2'-5' RNA ligase